MPEIRTHAFNEYFKKIIILENEIKELADSKFTEGKYYTDLLVVAVVDRSLKLSRGFRCLIESKNSQCAVIIARCYIDNIARFHGIKLMRGREHDYIRTFLDPQKKINSLKDNSNKKLTDKYLVEMIDKVYSGKIEPIYNEFCRYAHLSEDHHKACSDAKK